MANASHNKKKPEKQHDVRGASFLRIAKRLRANAGMTELHAEQSQVLDIIADAFESEGKLARHLR